MQIACRQYSTQIFSLAVLLCSYFVYNQIGGIDEASLDRLSLVTEVNCTKKAVTHVASIHGDSTETTKECFTNS